jgi:hypothetical protein
MYYGGRGITVCERWLSFEFFLADMGEKPSREYSIERRDVSGSYCPENCYWELIAFQSRNTTRVKRITINGETKLLHDWLREKHLSYPAYANRLKKGLTVDEAIMKPKGR